MTTWFLEGVGQMTMFDHDGGMRGSQNFRKSDHVVYGWPPYMSYERKFCRLSEYMQFQKVRQLKKSAYRSKWDLVDFDKCANSQESVNLRALSTLWNLPWPMTINSPSI